MTTLELLYKEILANPAEDAPRLAFADALEEEGSEASKRRSLFIRLQYDLFALGKPRRQFEIVAVPLHEKRGYFTSSKEDWTPWKAGERIDVHSRRGNTGAFVVYPGLRVEKVDTTDPLAGLVRVYFEADEDSVPYPAERVRQLEKECGELFDKGEYTGWGLEYPKTVLSLPTDNTRYAALWFERGFPSFLEIPGDSLAGYGDTLFSHYPISRVKMLSAVRVDEEVPTIAEVRDQVKPYRVAGKVVMVSDRVAACGEWIDILTARWPTVPKDGWDGAVHFPSYIRSGR